MNAPWILLGAIVLFLVAAFGAYVLRERRRDRELDRAREDERAKVAAAEAQLVKDRKAAAEHRDEQLARDPVERGNEAIEAARRRAGVLALALVLLPARSVAEEPKDCAYIDAARTHVLCTAEGFRLLVDELEHERHALAEVLAVNTKLAAELLAAHERVEALEAARPDPASPWSYVFAGGAGFALAVLTIALVR
jgi:hypothetical protein